MYFRFHFACMEQVSYIPSAVAGGAHNVLFSAYNLISDEKQAFPIINSPIARTEIPRFLEKSFEHVILDSGAFTLMLGFRKNEHSKADMIEWTDRLIDFVGSYVPMSIPCIEVDCQRAYGCELAWELRKKMRDRLPKHTIINVIHPEDIPRIEELVEFSQYVAIPVKRIRNTAHTATPTVVEKLVRFVRNRRPEVPIHLLGCMDNKVFSKVGRLITSADASSWLIPLRRGGYRLPDFQVNSEAIRIMYENLFQVRAPEVFYIGNYYAYAAWLVWKALNKVYQYGGY